MNPFDAFKAVMIHIVVSALWHHTLWCFSTDVADRHIASVCNLEVWGRLYLRNAGAIHQITCCHNPQDHKWIIMPLNCENLTRVLWFSWRWFSRLWYYGLWHRAVFHSDTNVSVELAGSIFRVLQVCSWRHYITPKLYYLPTRQHWVKTQKTEIPF